MNPTFYFTCHASDLRRSRIPEGASVMVVASSFWDEARRRFRINRPPSDHISELVIDSGGFTAAKRWGRYPWTLAQYVDWIREESRDVPLTWVACMDYACERDVDRAALATNRERIVATIDNEVQLRAMAPDIPWLGVLQGNTLDERAWDVERRRSCGLRAPLMGLGSICGRQAKEAASVLRFYRELLPGVRYHGFGLDVRTFDQGDDLYPLIASWDTAAWNWGKGQKNVDRPADLLRCAEESWSSYVHRMGMNYREKVIGRRLNRPRQLILEELP